MRNKFIWIIAGAVAIIAAVVTFVTVNSLDDAEVQSNTAAKDSGIEISTDAIAATASYYDIDIDGTTVEVFAVLASDGSVRLAMNTCQVCNGSPYAYFEQDGDYFICQNCGNSFSRDEVGLVSGGCNPVPITEDDYIEADGVITVSEDFLEENAYRFSTWKQF